MVIGRRKKSIEGKNTFRFSPKSNLTSKKAFTLAEILITMCMMGVLAAVLVPVIVQTSPDYNKVMFRKSLYTLQLAVSNMLKDNTNYPSGETGTDANGLTVEKGFNNTTAVTNTISGTTYNKFCFFLVDQLNTMKGGDSSCPVASVASGITEVATTDDGVIWRIRLAGSDATPASEFPLSNTNFGGVKVVFDVNGTKDPNCTKDTAGATWNVTVCGADVKDSDQFIVGVRYDGKLQVACSTPNTEFCSVPTDAYASGILATPTDNVK